MDELANLSFDIDTLTRALAQGAFSHEQVIDEVCRRVAKHRDDHIWIDLLPRETLIEQLAMSQAARDRGISQPLLGIPFAIKDNIDLAGRPTTAACPSFAFTARESATVVERLLAAGAIVVGKTNMDQFATGLTGTRSPYGIPRNPFDAKIIPGGSSSGSAVAVGAGLVSFALGTDTAGSGRVPSMYNNIVGMKPTRGLLSCAGVTPACKSLDCVSIHALTCADAKKIFEILCRYDPADPFSRDRSDLPSPKIAGIERFRFGVPREDQLQFFGSSEMAALFASAVERAKQLGGAAVTIDFSPFSNVAALLYEGPWLAERLMVARRLLDTNPDAIFPVTATVLKKGMGRSAEETFSAIHRLAALRQQTREIWKQIEFMMLPTAGVIYSVAQVEADPIGTNSRLGAYTNFANLLDLCAVAAPSGFTSGGHPFGVSFFAPAGNDLATLALASRFHAKAAIPPGAKGIGSSAPIPIKFSPSTIPIAVVGAHLSGEPLNYQLTQRGATLAARRRTAKRYRLYALPGTQPPKPGLARDETNGHAIELEVWNVPTETVGSFVAAIPPPLTIGSVELDDGSLVKCFLCESHALAGAADISHFGGWKAYLKSPQDR